MYGGARRVKTRHTVKQSGDKRNEESLNLVLPRAREVSQHFSLLHKLRHPLCKLTSDQIHSMFVLTSFLITI